MNRTLFLISLFVLSSASYAQEQVKVGEILDLEERIMVKKMTDELSKPNPNAPSPAPVINRTKAPKIVYPTETLAVYGTSATYYEGQLSMGGRIYTVRNGWPIQGYVVSAISPSGIELTKYPTAVKSRKKHREAKPRKVTLFAPLAVR